MASKTLVKHAGSADEIADGACIWIAEPPLDAPLT
jgi:hypothetical protein